MLYDHTMSCMFFWGGGGGGGGGSLLGVCMSIWTIGSSQEEEEPRYVFQYVLSVSRRYSFLSPCRKQAFVLQKLGACGPADDSCCSKVYHFYAKEHDSFRLRKLLWFFLLLCVSLSSIVYGLVCLIRILFDDWSNLVSLFMVCVTPSNALLVTV